MNQLLYDVYHWTISYLHRDVDELSVDQIQKLIKDKYKMIYAIHFESTEKGPNNALPVLQQHRLSGFQRQFKRKCHNCGKYGHKSTNSKYGQLFQTLPESDATPVANISTAPKIAATLVEMKPTPFTQMST